MLNHRPLLKRLLLIVILPVSVAMVGLVLFLRSSLPDVDGIVYVEGIRSDVAIERDKWGVPRIKASTDLDAFFALGYVHAQDRLWQLEIQRRTAAGRLSEVFGRESLELDKMMLTLGFRRSAQVQWEGLSEEGREALEAYSAGINAWLDESNTLPIEFLMLGIEPEPWTANDSLSWLKVISWNMSGNYSAEIHRYLLRQEVGVERTLELFPGLKVQASASDPAHTVARLDLFRKMSDVSGEFEKRLSAESQAMGSNAWVLSGNLTEGGLPILANDPHLQTQIPSLWYLAELEGDRLHAKGATLPGLPAIVFGHNGKIGWGGATLPADVQDLYIERTASGNVNQYELDGIYRDMEIVDEKIAVKADSPSFLRGEIEPLQWKARSTVHGPVISDVIGISGPEVISVKWSGFAKDDLSFDGIFRLGYAQNWDEFTDAVELITVPPLTLAYADSQNNIGFYSTGKIPVRSNGEGVFPSPGWSREFEWVDWIPFAEKPQAYNPESGIVVLANHKIVDEKYEYHLSRDWEPDYRARRISDLIASSASVGKLMGVDDMKSIQGDQVSLFVRELLPYLLVAMPGTEEQAKSLELLREWDGNSDMKSVAATLYQAWLRNFKQVILEDELNGDLLNYERADYLLDMIYEIPPAFFIDVLQNDKSEWCDNKKTGLRESCEDAVLEALGRGIDDLDKLLHGSMSTWHWEDVHNTRYPHTPFSAIKLLDLAFSRDIPAAGDDFTVNLGSSVFTMDEGFQQLVGPTYRQIVDFGNLDNSVFIQAPGQSGNIFSKSYDDMLELHRDVNYLPMSWNERPAFRAKLTLRNGTSGPK